MILLVDIFRWFGVVVVVAIVAHQMLALLRDARWLDDEGGWSDSPGARNDRARLLEDRAQ